LSRENKTRAYSVELSRCLYWLFCYGSSALFSYFASNLSALSSYPTKGCAPLAEWFVLGPCVVSLEESPSSSPSRPARLCISFVGANRFYPDYGLCNLLQIGLCVAYHKVIVV